MGVFRKKRRLEGSDVARCRGKGKTGGPTGQKGTNYIAQEADGDAETPKSRPTASS